MTDTAQPLRPYRPGVARDFVYTMIFVALVLLSVLVVATLHIHYGLQLRAAATVGLVYLAALIAGAALGRRSRHVSELNAEIDELKTELKLLRLERLHTQPNHGPRGRGPDGERAPGLAPVPRRGPPPMAAPGVGRPAIAPGEPANAAPPHRRPPPGRPAGPPPPHTAAAVPAQRGRTMPSEDLRASAVPPPAAAAGSRPPAHDAPMTAGSDEPEAGAGARQAAARSTDGEPVRPRSGLAEPVRHAPAPIDVASMQGLIEQLAAKLDQPLTPDERPGARPDSAAARDEAASRDGAPAPLKMPAQQPHPGPDVDSGVIPAASQPVGPVEKTTPAAAAAPTAADDQPAAPLGHLAVVAEAVEAKRMDVYLDPIMGLSDRKARHFELTVRLRDDIGQEIEPALYGAGVAGTGLLARIDAAKLEQAAEIVQRLKTRQSKAALFSSLTGESLADENFLGSFADLLTDEDGMGARLVLNFSQAEARNFSTVHWQSISAMASIGLKFALEGVTDLDMDFEALQENGFAFVKLDASVFLEGLPMPGGHVPPADICRHLAGLGFGLIVGGIVAEKDLARIHGFGAVLGQGTLFGAPRSVALERARRAA